MPGVRVWLVIIRMLILWFFFFLSFLLLGYGQDSGVIPLIEHQHSIHTEIPLL